VTTSQVATSQMYIFPSGNFPKVRLGLLRRRRLQRGRTLQLGWARGPNAAARTDLGSCRPQKLNIWEITIWKNTLGQLPLGKFFSSKVPNIQILPIRPAVRRLTPATVPARRPVSRAIPNTLS